MGSAGKKKTTMAKLNRETKLRDKRAQKEARKAARKLNAADEDAADGNDGLGTASDELDAGSPDGDEPASVSAVPDVNGGAPPSES